MIIKRPTFLSYFLSILVIVLIAFLSVFAYICIIISLDTFSIHLLSFVLGIVCCALVVVIIVLVNKYDRLFLAQLINVVGLVVSAILVLVSIYFTLTLPFYNLANITFDMIVLVMILLLISVSLLLININRLIMQRRKRKVLPK